MIECDQTTYWFFHWGNASLYTATALQGLMTNQNVDSRHFLNTMTLPTAYTVATVQFWMTPPVRDRTITLEYKNT